MKKLFIVVVLAGLASVATADSVRLEDKPFGEITLNHRIIANAFCIWSAKVPDKECGDNLYKPK